MYLFDKKYRMSLDVDFQSKEVKDFMNLLNIHEIDKIRNILPLDELIR